MGLDVFVIVFVEVTRTGEAVCAFRPEHKVPFESLVFAARDRQRFLSLLPDDFVIVRQVPYRIHLTL